MEDVVVAFVTLGFFVLLFGFIALMRFMGYRETMGLAEKGLVRGDLRRNGGGKDTLRWGIVITSVGLALCLGLYPLGLVTGSRFPLGLGPWMLAGLLPTFFGLGLVLIYAVTREKSDDGRPPTSAGGRPVTPVPHSAARSLQADDKPLPKPDDRDA